ncbi:MAG: RHS repeat-associated core domain-containing protein [Caldilineales bacterium]|nr:RHS repeat-associated core domain-containing protein [Caldilineales bacterium]
MRYQWRTGAPPIATQTQYRYSGQRLEAGVGAPSPASGLDRGLYFYGARWYDASLARFVQPDTIVPEPGNPQSLNRYSYTLNNPLRYTDPTGHAPQHPGDPDPNNAPCSTQWCWENRWYRAHGYDWNSSTNHWSNPTSAHFYDEGIAQEFFAEFDIELSGPWTLSQLNLVGQAMVDFYRKIGSATRLGNLIGRGNRFIRSGNGAGPCSVDHSACTLFSTIWFYDKLFTYSDSFVKGTVVHELAHVIDFNSVIPTHTSRGAKDTWFALSFGFPDMGRITKYGESGRAEYWAEAVTDWVYGAAYKGKETGRRNLRSLQVNLMDKWLGGK